ncbi:MAG: YihY family inner membrane protein [Betaproteobacteria bacterium]|nr:YihY family inner membrane protein [Betaproteobacteria bacterium]
MLLLAPFRLVARVVRRFHVDRCTQAAASLSFSTLLGLVPLIAIALALITYSPFATGLGTALEKFLLANLLPDKAGAIIAKYVSQFAHKATRLTLIGAVVLAITALMQMLTIEHTFNVIWRVKAKRPLLRRIAMHALALLLGPLIFGGSLLAISYLAGVSFGLVNEPQWLNTLVFRILPYVFMTLLFALLYYTLPNRAVVKWHAVVGGVFATLGFILMQRLFGFYLANFPAYTVIYGAFATIPIFLVWLYLSWSVILVGALIVAELPGAAVSRSHHHH